MNTKSATWSDINGPECVNSQMENWGTSVSKQKELCKLLDEWYITNFFLFVHRIFFFYKTAYVSFNLIGLPNKTGLCILQESAEIMHTRPGRILARQSLSLNNMLKQTRI